MKLRQYSSYTVADIPQTLANYPFARMLFRCSETAPAVVSNPALAPATITDDIRGLTYTLNSPNGFAPVDAVNHPYALGIRTSNTAEGFGSSGSVQDGSSEPGLDAFLFSAMIDTVHPGNAGYIQLGYSVPSGIDPNADDSIRLTTNNQLQPVIADNVGGASVLHGLSVAPNLHTLIGRWRGADLYVDYYIGADKADFGIITGASQPLFAQSFKIIAATASMYVRAIGYGVFQNGVPADIRAALSFHNAKWRMTPENRIWYPGWAGRNL